MICNRLDVVLVPFPFMEIPASKRRPALVLSTQDFNRENEHSIFAMVTTARSSSWSSDYNLIAPEAAGLVKNCYIRWKTFTLPNELILRRIGILAGQDQIQLDNQVRQILMPH